jgi:excisionase family DNA binding protein
MGKQPRKVATVGYLDVKSAAKRFGVHPRLIYKEIAEGRIPAVKIGAPGSKRPVIRVPLEALEAWEKAQLGGK